MAVLQPVVIFVIVATALVRRDNAAPPCVCVCVCVLPTIRALTRRDKRADPHLPSPPFREAVKYKVLRGTFEGLNVTGSSGIGPAICRRRR